MSELSASTALLSIDGTTAFSSVRNVRGTITNDAQAGVASNTENAQVLVAGISDSNGTFDYYGRSVFGLVVPGSTYTMYSQDSAAEWSHSIMVDAISLRIDIENGGIISGTVNWSGNGAVTYGTSATSLTNTSLPQMFGGVGCKAKWQPRVAAGTLGTEADLPGVRSMDINIARQNRPYANSDTNGFRKRVAGPLEASVTLNMHQGALGFFGTDATLLKPGTMGILKPYVSGSLFYLMKFMMLRSIANDMNIETGDVIGQSLTFGWSSHADIGGTITKGALTDPASVDIYS